MDNFYTGKFLFARKSGILLYDFILLLSVLCSNLTCLCFCNCSKLWYVSGHHPALPVTVGNLRFSFPYVVSFPINPLYIDSNPMICFFVVFQVYEKVWIFDKNVAVISSKQQNLNWLYNLFLGCWGCEDVQNSTRKWGFPKGCVPILFF